MSGNTIFEKSGLRITVVGSLTKKELEILKYEIDSTISGILKFRKFEGDSE